MKKAFTLSEMLVCIAIMGVLVSIMMTCLKAKPNTNMVMFRKAYNITANVVQEMMNSTSYYFSEELSDLGTTEVFIEGEKIDGATKFCRIFASLVNTVETQHCAAGTSGPSFTTTDGIDWYLPPKSGTPGTWAGQEYIQVDVNGSSTAPNCALNTSGYEAASCRNPDKFNIYISKEAKLSVRGTAAEYLKTSQRISR